MSTTADEIIENARAIDQQIVEIDEEIEEASERVRTLKKTHERLVRELRAVVRPTPLFDGDTTA